jgi:ATP-dependent DNA ligase
MKPMLARTVGPKFDQYPCFCQPKLNGVRALYQLGTFQSRDEKVWRPEVLLHLTAELSTLSLNNVILDGELYVHGWRLQRINGAVAVNRLQPRDDTGEVCFHVFDVVEPARKFSDRWLDVYNALLSANLPHIKPVPTALAQNKEIMEQCFHLYTSSGYEGIMLRPDGLYEFGEHEGRNGNQTPYRSKTLWKHKHWEDDEFYCVGVTEGEGKAKIGVGALVLQVGYPTSDLTFKVGTGFTDEDRIEFAQNPPVGRQVRVRYLCLTDDGIPFNPSFIAIM